MIFWRTHWAWACDWEEWDPDGWNGRGSTLGRWRRRSVHFGDYETAMNEHDRVRSLPPGEIRDVSVSRRPVGAPVRWL